MSRRIQQVAAICVLFPVAAGLLWLATAPGPAAGLTADAKADPPADFKAYSETIPGSKIAFDMVPIPGGTFTMGSPAAEPGREADEGPQHPVTLKPFWMASKAVTWDEYDLFWKTKPGPGRKEDVEPDAPKDADAVTRPTPPYADETWDHGREGHPVLCITWHAAMQYCRWLSFKTGKTYRLPTEAEWEYAARAGTKTAYFFGDDPKNLKDYAWFADNAGADPHKGGELKPNPWGLYDIYGNVAEWCLDRYKKDYYADLPLDKPALQPVLLPENLRFGNVVRGGSWADDAAQCRSSARRASDKKWIKLDPQRPQSIWWLTSADFVGFRIVRAVEEQDNLKGVRSKITLSSK
jgi:formylglycine-generating enzyme required for sulfatase activity